MTSSAENDYKARLIACVKKEVKQVMEESVTKKFVHEESGSVTSLCGAVEACLSQGLRRRALGLFKTSSTTALLHKIAKHSPEAARVSKKVIELENVDPNRRSSSSSDSTTKPVLMKNMSLQNVNLLPKYLWIRLALFEKQLSRIIDYLVANANRYYDKDALVADPDYGSILSSLLVGPCALDYSRTKTADHFWTDPPADELLQRHRISSSHSTPPPVRRPIPNFRRSLNTSSEDSTNRCATQHIAKDYVESLHQNSRATLLFGKNNVLVSPPKAGHTEPMPGYLSLHQSANCLTIKWTPNQLMNGFTESDVPDKSIYWDYAIQVRLDEVVYVHCHQDVETGGTVILVGQDGVQRPPVHFPRGGHMLAFLNCLETGLLPHGRLDPPLWSQQSTTRHSKRKRPLPSLVENEDEPKDFVFRIVDSSNHKEILKRHDLMNRNYVTTKVRAQLGSSSTSSESSTKSFSIDQNGDGTSNVCIKAVCDSMKRQIISRAFYGWLAYCRHLSTVRTHLSGLVHGNIIGGDGAKAGLTTERWAELYVDGVVQQSDESTRHYKFGSTSEQRDELSEQTKQAYETTMSEWLAVEAIVRQRDKETQANAIAKLSSESTSGEQAPLQIPRDLSNDVFEDVSDYEYVSNEDDTDEEKPKRPKKTKQNTVIYDGSDDAHDELCNDDLDRELVSNVIVTNPSVDMSNVPIEAQRRCSMLALAEEGSSLDTLDCIETHGLVSPARSACVSPASSNGGVYSTELLESFGLNLHRIEKDVQRCDRNYWYFSGDNLDKLRNVMCTYVWEHLDIGYMQGMCDLVAPLLVIFNDESLTYACFCHLMERMVENFPNGNAMDCHFANMRSLIQILDSEMYELMHSHGDYTHFYFCYRWFLLDFKRELVYNDVFAFWEVIWAAQQVASSHYVLFLALALLEIYRDIILSNSMDFTDIIKFFNEMAERHDAQEVLRIARELVLQLQLLIENKRKMFARIVFVSLVLGELVWCVPVRQEHEHVKFLQHDDEVEKSLVEYLDWYYDEYVERTRNDVDDGDDEMMQADQPTSQDYGPLGTLIANFSAKGENQSDVEYIRTMRNRRDNKTVDDRTKDTWIQMLKDNILRQVGRMNSTVPKTKDRVDVSGLNITHLFPGGEALLDGDFVAEKIRSYYPSCEIPKNTDQDLWKDENTMNLYFNVEYPESDGVSIATATLRLYRVPQTNVTVVESSCENSSIDEQLMRISIYWYTKSLKRQRVKRRLSDSKVIGENAKWVELSVLPATKAWVKGKNLGLAVIVEDQEGTVLKADRYFKGASCMVGTSTPKPIPTVIIDAARWANELERVHGNDGRSTSTTLYNNLLLLPTVDVCTLEFPQNSTQDPSLLSNWRKACDFKRIHEQKSTIEDKSSPTRHIRHQKQHMHDLRVDPRSRIVNQKMIMTNEELRNLNARLTNASYSSVNR
ncbi:hypothetical protein FQR65_LT06915 [Abscondita terminalis]|nr:hypothetical protein FQR65_LT06915 [Abscondita terminalis]